MQTVDNDAVKMESVRLEAIEGLSTCLVNASLLNDAALQRVLYEAYKFICTRFATGSRDPFFYETFGDFGPNDRTRIQYYLRGLRMARKYGKAKHSILVELGECYAREERLGQAKTAFEEAIEDTRFSRQKDDREIRARAIVGLKNVTSMTNGSPAKSSGRPAMPNRASSRRKARGHVRG